MEDPICSAYDKRGELLVKNLRSRHFEACYVPDCAQALEKALELIPQDSLVGWGGAMSAQQIGLLDALRAGPYQVLDRDTAQTPQEREAIMRRCLGSDVFLCGANALSLDGQMVSIDGNGNRVAAIVYGPRSVVVIAGMNKVCDTLEDALRRARTVAAPRNKQRFPAKTPCGQTGTCADCISPECICNQILITRHCKPAGRIKFVLVGQDLGL